MHLVNVLVWLSVNQPVLSLLDSSGGDTAKGPPLIGKGQVWRARERTGTGTGPSMPASLGLQASVEAWSTKGRVLTALGPSFFNFGIPTLSCDNNRSSSVLIPVQGHN